MSHWTYAAVLAFILVGSGWLEVALRTRLLPRWRRWLLSVLPAAAVFIVWDLYAIAAGHWSFDRASVLGVVLPGGIPLEEVLFFVVVPTAGLLTFEAVRSVRGWPAGDEPVGDEGAVDQRAGDEPPGDERAGDERGGPR